MEIIDFSMISLYSCPLSRPPWDNYCIQSDVFKSMHSLKAFILFYNLKGFVHGNGIEWMRYLGSNSSTLTPDLFKGTICDDACQKLMNSLFELVIEQGIYLQTYSSLLTFAFSATGYILNTLNAIVF
jgi:hypothetical protein